MSVPTTVFTPRETPIPGLLVFDIEFPSDERGWFQEKFQRAKLLELGLPPDFKIVQNNVSFNKDKGVIRGFHAEPWEKYISVIMGSAFVAYLDLRKGPSFGKVFTTTLTNNMAIFLPRGVANSFQTLEDNTYYAYSTSDHWRADNYNKYCFVNLSDPEIGIYWPITLGESLMSDRDKNHPLLKDIKPMVV